MIEGVDVDRLIAERVPRKSLPLQHAPLIQKVIEEAVQDMKAILRENRDLQYVKIWSENKTKALNTMLETENIEPATPAYITIKQISDAAMHFTAEYRAHQRVTT